MRFVLYLHNIDMIVMLVSSYIVFLFRFFVSYFQLSKEFNINFLTWRVWIGLWVMIILWVVVALEGCFLVEHFTRFTEEVFSVLISMLFIYEAINFLVKVSACHIVQILCIFISLCTEPAYYIIVNERRAMLPLDLLSYIFALQGFTVIICHYI